MTELNKSELPYVQNLCEIDKCLNIATRIVKSLTTYSWTCDNCYRKLKV